MYNASIRSIEVYHGSKAMGNDFYINHFKKRGKDVSHFLKDIIGRDNRYLVKDDEENSLTMSINAAKKTLEKSGLTGNDIDMIVFSSQLPEYVAPPSSLHIHNAIGGKQDCVCYDMNANCIGMSLALENVCKYMSANENLKRALIVGCDYINMTIDEENENSYGHYGDAACAVILEKTEEDRGLVESKIWVNSQYHNAIVFPNGGFSKMFKTDDIKNLKLKFNPPKVMWLEDANRNIRNFLSKNSLTTSDVSMYCFSQYAVKSLEALRELLGIDEEQSIYIGNEYGYTGTTSPFIALYEAIKREKVKRGDYVVIWTFAAGVENIALLFKY